MYKACIFDLDGTVADTVESIAHVANQVLDHFGRRLSRWRPINILRGTAEIC